MTTPYIQSKRNKQKIWLSWIVIIFLLICLAGCVKNTPASETIADSAQQSLNAITSTIKPECKTQTIETQINATHTAIKAMVKACESEKDAIIQEKIRWQWAFFALAIIIAIHVGRKVLK